jgi:hypothetical protein
LTLEQIIENLKKAQEIASEKFGINNILQPGIIKELIIANILGHEVITDKDNADAKDKSGNIFEYLTSIHRPKGDPNAGCKFQIDRILSESSSRILRNKGFYFGIFKDHLNVEEILRIETDVVNNEINRQLQVSKNSISHANFSLKWVKNNGKQVYP